MNTMANRHYNHINLGLDAADGETEVSDSRVAFATEKEFTLICAMRLVKVKV